MACCLFDVGSVKTLPLIKRSMSPGYAGIQNKLFFQNNTPMLFGDKQKMGKTILKEIENS